MADQTIKGRNTILHIYGAIKDETGTAVAEAYFPVACLTSNSITHTNATVEGTVTKCNQTPETSYGGESYSISADAENMENDGLKASYDAVFEARKKSIDESGYVYFKIVTTHGSGITPATTTKFGKGIIPELGLESPAEGAETFNFTINGVGSLSATDLHV